MLYFEWGKITLNKDPITKTQISRTLLAAGKQDLLIIPVCLPAAGGEFEAWNLVLDEIRNFILFSA